MKFRNVKRTYKLADEEWIAYRDCPKDELHNCCWYEYLREASWEGCKKFDHCHEAFLSSFPGWQLKPWLSMSPAIRKKGIARYYKEHILPIEIQSYDPPNMPADMLKDKQGKYQDFVTVRDTFFPTYSCFVHMVEWHRHDAAIVNEFKRWLKTTRKQVGEYPADFRRRTTDKEELKWLAARRLLKAYGAPDLKCSGAKSPLTLAVEKVLGDGKSLYYERSDWYRAQRSANRFVMTICLDEPPKNPACDYYFPDTPADPNPKDRQ